eukprot:10414805-Karenia_brevis.AAC.1
MECPQRLLAVWCQARRSRTSAPQHARGYSPRCGREYSGREPSGRTWLRWSAMSATPSARRAAA